MAARLRDGRHIVLAAELAAQRGQRERASERLHDRILQGGAAVVVEHVPALRQRDHLGERLQRGRERPRRLLDIPGARARQDAVQLARAGLALRQRREALLLTMGQRHDAVEHDERLVARLLPCAQEHAALLGGGDGGQHRLQVAQRAEALHVEHDVQRAGFLDHRGAKLGERLAGGAELVEQGRGRRQLRGEGRGGVGRTRAEGGEIRPQGGQSPPEILASLRHRAVSSAIAVVTIALVCHQARATGQKRPTINCQKSGTLPGCPLCASRVKVNAGDHLDRDHRLVPPLPRHPPARR